MRRNLLTALAILALLTPTGTAADLRVGAAAADIAADDSMVIGGGIGPGKATGQEGQLRAVAIVLEKPGAGKVALVMAHGSSDDGLCWTNLAKEFESKFDIILIDARGHGLSDPPKPGDPYDVQADDLAGLIRELKLDRPIVMGHSMGSFATAAFAANTSSSFSRKPTRSVPHSAY